MKKISILDYPEFILGGGNNNTLFRGFSDYGIENSSAGIKVEFQVTTTSLEFSYTAFQHVHCMANFGASLMKGVLFRIKNSQGGVIKRGVCLNKNLTVEENHLIYKSNTSQILICEFFLPYMVAISQFFIFIDDNSELYPYKLNRENIVFLGGVNSLGSGCTFQNTTMPFIVSDSLNLQSINLAKNSYNFYNVKCLELVSKYKPKYVICELFASGTSLQYMENNIRNFVEKVILLCPDSYIIFWGFPLLSSSLDLNKKHQLFREIKSVYSSKNFNSAIFLDCGELFKNIDYDKYTISPYFINDYANYVIAQKIIEIIKVMGLNNGVS